MNNKCNTKREKGDYLLNALSSYAFYLHRKIKHDPISNTTFWIESIFNG